MKTARIAVIVLCMALLILPSAAIPIWGNEDTGGENRPLADFPVLASAEEGLNRNFSGDFEAWLCDHFAFRNVAVRADAQLNYTFMRTASNDQVIIGRSDWLYFAPTAPDYTGENRLTQPELDAIADNLRIFAESYVQRGARVFLAIIPNKSTLYPQYMPQRYHMRENGGNIPLLREACGDLPITWIDLSAPLRSAADGERQIYYRTDTHWNALGSAIAAQVVLGAMGKDSGSYTVGDDIAFSDGDLARLLGLTGYLKESVPEVTPAAVLPEADYSAREFTVSGSGEDRLTVFRDSFGTAIGPWLAGAYGSCEMIWSYPLECGHPADDVLVLICERNIREYLSSAPDPDCSGDIPPEGEDGMDSTVTTASEVLSRDAFTEMDEDDDFFDDEGDENDDFFDDSEEEDPFEDPEEDGDVLESTDTDGAGTDSEREDIDDMYPSMRRVSDGI